MFKVALKRASKGILGVYLALSALRFVGTAPTWVTQYLTMDRLATGDFSGGGTMQAAGLCSNTLSIVVAVVVATLSIGLLRALRKQLVEGEGAISGFADAFGHARARLWHTMGAYLLTVVAIAIGALFCVLPGLVAAFLFVFAAYLVAAADEEIVDSFKRSFELAKKNLTTLLLGLVGVVAVAIVMALLNFAVVAALTAMVGTAGIVIASVIVFLISVVVGYVVFLFLGALLITLETADAGIPLQV